MTSTSSNSDILHNLSSFLESYPNSENFCYQAPIVRQTNNQKISWSSKDNWVTKGEVVKKHIPRRQEYSVNQLELPAFFTIWKLDNITIDLRIRMRTTAIEDLTGVKSGPFTTILCVKNPLQNIPKSYSINRKKEINSKTNP